MIILISCNATQTTSINKTDNTENYIEFSDNSYIVNRGVEEFIMNEESFRSNPYKCMGGMLTVGYGTKARNLNDIIDKSEAQLRLREYLNSITYKKITRYGIENLTNSQLIAISSFDFNTNKLKNLIENNQINCEKILLYDKVKVKQSDNTYKYVVSEGLKKRRQREYNLCIK